MKSSFVLYYDYADHFGLLSDEELGRLLRAVMVYEMDGMAPCFDGALKMAFSFIRANLDRDREKWLERLRINRENGAKGGRPRKDTVVESDGFSEKPKKGVTVTGTVTDNDNVIVTGNDTVTGKREVKFGYAEYVSLSETEYGALCKRYGKDAADKMIEILDNYKGADPERRKYVSDYRAILSWVVGRYEEGVRGDTGGMRGEIERAKRQMLERYG